MEIQLFPSLPSTQTYLTAALREKRVHAPLAVIALEQTAGIGSRDNSWEGEEGNFFASIAVKLSDLPNDLPLSSASIYFSFIMKKILLRYHDKVWLKWPNDFYLGDNKIGGTITKKIEDILVCGMGINLKKNQTPYSALQVDVSPQSLLKIYLEELEKYPDWKQVFSEYRVEFELSRRFSVHIENRRKSLYNTQLCDDGSLLIDGKKVFSSR